MSLKDQAIQTALVGDWKAALSLNLELLKEDPQDIETLNRVGFAYTALGKIRDAKNIYQTVLKLDDKNPIALKNLRRIAESDAKNPTVRTPCFIGQVSTMFVEETGKTKVLELVNLADRRIISDLMAGEILYLSIKRLKIFLLDEKKRYVGMLPDDIGKRLIKFINGGNGYQAFVKSSENHRITVFIKETTRANRFKNQPSFSFIEKSKNDFVGKNYPVKNHEEEFEEE